MTALLIIEANTPDMIALGGAAARGFQKCLAQIDPDLDIRIAAPYVADIEPQSLDDIDGVIFTGSGVAWSADAAEAAPQRRAMETVFAKGIASWGSCNGLQLAAVVLGGSVQASPNGLEVGVARATRKTDAGKAHPALKGRPDTYSAPCIHRDEVKTLPTGAVLLAENDHSPVQSFAYAQDGIDFWGAQYHPELESADIASYLKKPGTLFEKKAHIVEDLILAETDPNAAARIGATLADLQPEMRTIELANWLVHVKDRMHP